MPPIFLYTPRGITETHVILYFSKIPKTHELILFFTLYFSFMEPKRSN
uniref:Uncharacterized protein n=1 Tax=Arundo donax TaxID=35708 RepID=A0A0A8ZWV9_ARUDO